MGQLSRRISPFTLFMLSTNSIIGSGWLLVPLYAAKIAGPASIIAWLIGGFSAILVACTFAELATMLPVAGGTAHIPQLSHGPLASFLLGWIAWLTALMLAPIEVQAVLQYASLYFPSLMHIVNGIPVLAAWGYVWATILMLGLCLINILSYKGLMRFNFILFIFKFTVIIATAILIYNTKFTLSNFAGITEAVHTQAGWKAILSCVATAGIVFAFNGFRNGVEMAGEAKKLWIALPISTAGAVGACLLIYLVLQITFIGALDPSAFRNGWQALSFPGDMGPFVGIAAALGLFVLLKFIYVNSVVSPLGAGLVYVTATARIVYALSKIGYMPKLFSKLNRHHLPIYAIALNFCVGMMTFLPLPGWQAMVKFLVSTMVITYSMGPIALCSLRKTMPDRERPFRLPFATGWCFFAFYCCNLFSFWTGWETMSKLAIALLVGLTIFAFTCWRGKIKVEVEKIKFAYWMIPYLFGLVTISYLGSFGGRNIIPFGWDFLVIGVFSTVVMLVAIRSRVPHTKESVDYYIENQAGGVALAAEHA